MKSQEENVQLLLKSCLFRDFSASELLELLPLLAPERKRLEQGEVLIRVDDPAQRIGLVVSGELSACRSGGHDLSRRAAGDVFGLTALFSSRGKSCVTITAAADAEVLLFDIRPLLADGRYKDRLKSAALMISADQTTRDILKMDMLLLPSMRERILACFNALRDESESDIFQIRSTQAELADYLGVNRSALSRELNKMQREGILEILPNRRYRMMNWKTDLPEIRPDEMKAKQTYTDIDININIGCIGMGKDKIR